MALRFQPYPYREQPQPDFNESVVQPIFQGLGMYQQMKSQDAMLALQKAKEAREAKQFAFDYEDPYDPARPLDLQRPMYARTPQQNVLQMPEQPSFGMPGDQGPQPSGSLPQGTMGPMPTAYGPQPQGAVDWGGGMQGPQPAGSLPTPQMDLSGHFAAWKQNGMPPRYDHADFGYEGTPANNMDWYQRIMSMPGAKRRAEAMGYMKERTGIEKEQSETEKNLAQASLFRRGGPGTGKGQWKLNIFTGQYDWYPNEGPPGGSAGGAPPAGMPAPSSAPTTTPPTRAPLKDVMKAKAAYAEEKALADSIVAEITRVEGLNANAYGGYGGAAQMKVRSGLNMGTDSPKFTNTADVLNTMQGQVAKVLKSTFGGQLSNEERNYLNQVYGALPQMSNQERAVAMKNVKNMVMSKLASSEAKYNALAGIQGGRAPQARQKIKVSNGSETLYIDPQDAAEAAQDGFSQVNE